jgi:hypothetical protein
MAFSSINEPAHSGTKDHHGGALLLVKVGTHPKLTEIVPRLQDLLPQTKFFGIGVSGTQTFENIEIVANEDELLLGAFDDWWQRQLFVEPDLYLKVLPHESRLLRMTQRAVDHDRFSLKSPSFPTEKHLGSFEGRRQLVLRQVAFWDFILRHHKISAVVTQNLPHNFWDAVLHVVAEARKVPYLCFHEVRPFLGSLYVYRHPSEMGNLEFGRSLIELTRQKIGLVGNSSSRRDQMLRQVGPELLQRTWEAGNSRKPSLRAKSRGLLSNSGQLIPKIYRYIGRRTSICKSRKESNQVFWVDPIPEKYFLIELQPPSNATSLTKGFMYGDARELLAHIAHSLPIGYSLVVKESSRDHMRSLPRRQNFWRQVAALPSVVLVHPDTKADVLLKDSAGLIEVGYSTLVLKALHSRTRVIILGQSHLPSIPGLHRVSAQDDLGRVLQYVVNGTQDGRSSSEELTKSLGDWCDETQAATLEGALSSFPREMLNHEQYHDRVVNNVASLIANWFKMTVDFEIYRLNK